MRYRTDLIFEDGKVQPRQTATSADSRRALPEVKPTDRLSSTVWGDALLREAGSDDPVLDDIKDTHTRMANAFADLLKVRETQSPDDTQAAHLQKVASLTNRKLSELAAKSDQTLQRVTDKLVVLEGEAKKALGFIQRGNASELRAILRGMGEKERADTIGAAISNRDGELLAAVLDGVHPLQAGFKDAETQRTRFDHALHQHAPKLLKMRKALEKGRSLLKGSFDDLMLRSDAISAKDLRESYEQEAQRARDAAQKLEV